MKLDSLVLGYAGAIVSALSMVLLWVLGNLGYYLGAVNMMSQWHEFFNLTISGLVWGIVEATVVSFVVFYLFGVIYNKLVK